MAWPEDLGHGTFTGRFGWMDADGVDEGTEPDITAASGGTVEITPAVTTVRYTGTAGALSLVARRAVGIIDYEGYLCTKNADGTAGPRGMSFPATDNDALTPSEWTYRVSVKLPGGVALPAFSTSLPTGAVVNLATAIPVDASPGVVKVVDETIAVRAEAAAVRAEKVAGGIEDAIAEAIASGDYTGPPGEPGRDGHTPEITFDGTTIVVDGVPGPDLKGDPGEGGGGIAGAIPIFATLAEAQAWEAENPGKVALVLGDGGEVPVDPEEPGGPNDFTHQFLGGDVTAFAWADAKAGLSLPKEGTGSATASDGAASFPGTVSYGPATIPFTDEPTITAVVRTTGTAYAFIAGHPIDHALTGPSGKGFYTIGNADPEGPTGTTGDWQIVTARWGKPGVTQRAITVGASTATRTTSKEPPTTMSFRIGGVFSNAYRYTGDIREIRVYDRRLTDEEVYELHTALSAQYGITL
ncbi:LamG domain-containing protein [Brachybacterium sp. HMSC06H03]|uniref:LamG domain-containing protein n=1 Tax=Brachybacterium sp. HMSC06H03 TaxID=1581127 RepID=UPI00114CA238|nr:LamG domain-containing protein [Brachybacterium sp. HMSC06H03]